ncbi:MAG TPA: ferrous iron transport protein A, partial [Dialister sp.]|nr:ferrous iron transport protein A [Dialister sp.]
MMPLVFAKAGDTVTITRISGKDEIRQHLADLGFIVEAKVLIISQMGGN